MSNKFDLSFLINNNGRVEEFLNSFQEKSTAQKMIIVTAITVGLLLFITIMFVLSTPRQKNTTTNSFTPSNQETSLSQAGSLPKPTSNTSYTYKGNHFQVTFNTADYKASGNKNNGEDNIILQSTYSGLPYFISFTVQPTSKLPVENLYAIFDHLNYSKSFTTLNSLPVVRYKGSVKGKSASSYDDVVIFFGNGFTYKIQLSYQANAEDSRIEDKFNTLLKTLNAF